MRKRLVNIGARVAVGLVAFAYLPGPAQMTAVAQSEGSTPSEAVNLGEGQATGHLAPGEAAWYVYEPYLDDGATEQAGVLTLIFTPAVALGADVSGVNFGIFSTGQVTSGEDITTVPPIGMGGYVSRDGDPNTAQLLWHGNLPVPATYFIRVYNDTAIDIDYWLFTGDVISAELGADTAEAEAEAAPAGPTPAAPPTVPMAETITGHVEVEQEQWYTFVPFEAGHEAGQSGYMFTLFFTPRYGPSGDHVAFEIVTAQQLMLRQHGQTYLNTGAGAIVSRDGDPVTGERLWSGQLTNGEAYLMRIFNGSDVPIDFRLFQGDIEHAPLEAPPPPDETSSVSGEPDVTSESSEPDVKGSERSAARWGDWHVSVTCVAHCDK